MDEYPATANYTDACKQYSPRLTPKGRKKDRFITKKMVYCKEWELQNTKMKNMQENILCSEYQFISQRSLADIEIKEQ